MSKSQRNEEMLKLIEDRLNSYTVEETIERLHSYQGGGPTIREFEKSLMRDIQDSNLA